MTVKFFGVASSPVQCDKRTSRWQTKCDSDCFWMKTKQILFVNYCVSSSVSKVLGRTETHREHVSDLSELIHDRK